MSFSRSFFRESSSLLWSLTILLLFLIKGANCVQNSGSFHSVPAAMIPSLAIVCNTCPCGLLFPWLTSGVFNLSLASCECRRTQGFLESAWAFMTFVCLLVPCLPHFLMQQTPPLSWHRYIPVLTQPCLYQDKDRWVTVFKETWLL